MDTLQWLTVKLSMRSTLINCNSMGACSAFKTEKLSNRHWLHPKHLWTYRNKSELNVSELAAAYGANFARNDGCRDGNKRLAFLAMYTFLRLNGRKLNVEEEAVVEVMREVAQDNFSEEALAEWLWHHSESR